MKPPAATGVAPLLVVGIGNASRGDDALGPGLIAALQALGVQAEGQVELQEDYQLQIEHALDLVGRRAVLYVDASRVPVAGGAELKRIAASAHHPPASHALRPEAVLSVHARVCGGPAPEAWMLAIEGAAFDLGAALSPAAQRHLARAIRLACAWLAERGHRPTPASDSVGQRAGQGLGQEVVDAADDGVAADLPVHGQPAG